LWFLANY